MSPTSWHCILLPQEEHGFDSRRRRIRDKADSVSGSQASRLAPRARTLVIRQIHRNSNLHAKSTVRLKSDNRFSSRIDKSPTWEKFTDPSPVPERSSLRLQRYDHHLHLRQLRRQARTRRSGDDWVAKSVSKGASDIYDFYSTNQHEMMDRKDGADGAHQPE